VVVLYIGIGDVHHKTIPHDDFAIRGIGGIHGGTLPSCTEHFRDN